MENNVFVTGTGNFSYADYYYSPPSMLQCSETITLGSIETLEFQTSYPAKFEEPNPKAFVWKDIKV